MNRILVGAWVVLSCGGLCAQSESPYSGRSGIPEVPAYPMPMAANASGSISQPLPTVVANVLPTAPTVPPPGSYQLADCREGICRQPLARTRDRSCWQKIAAWWRYQPCPGPSICRLQSYQPPLRAYFPCTPGCGTGGCGTGGCGVGSGSGCGTNQCIVPNIPNASADPCGPVQRRWNLLGGWNLTLNRADPCESDAPRETLHSFHMPKATTRPAECTPEYLRGACPPTRLGLRDRLYNLFNPMCEGCGLPMCGATACSTCGDANPIGYPNMGAAPTQTVPSVSGELRPNP